MAHCGIERFLDNVPGRNLSSAALALEAGEILIRIISVRKGMLSLETFLLG